MDNLTLAAKGTVEGVFFAFGLDRYCSAKIDPRRAIIALADHAKTSIDAALFTLTEPQLVAALSRAQARGVRVQVVVDRGQARGKRMAVALQQLSDAGVKVILAVKQKALMHNKVAIFDGLRVVTGSFNWTTSAERANDENLVVLFGQEIGDAYTHYAFQRVLELDTLDYKPRRIRKAHPKAT